MEELDVSEINTRKAIVLKLNFNKKKCFLLGYGIYEGKFIPDTVILRRILNKKKRRLVENLIVDKIECCRFKMDDGQILYQFDGWFIPEKRFIDLFVNDSEKEGWKVINVDIYGKRRKNES